MPVDFTLEVLVTCFFIFCSVLALDCIINLFNKLLHFAMTMFDHVRLEDLKIDLKKWF